MSKHCATGRTDSPLLLAAVGVILGLASSAHAGEPCRLELRFIGDHSIPASQKVGDDVFGGISGIDYDPSSSQWYLVSDERSDQAPPRFFTAALHFDAQRIESVRLQASFRISTAAIDAESIRVDAKNRALLLAGEGDVARGIDPWLKQISFSGELLRETPLPPQLRATRPNRSIEGLAFESEHRNIWIGLESPLLQDGPPADERQASDVRLTQLSPDGQVRAQYVYQTDLASPTQEGETSDIGVSEILTASDTELLVLERSGVKLVRGGFRFRTRLYCADLRHATDVSTLDTLKGQTYRRVSKRLVFDFEHQPGADNLEGMAWGPGRESLVFVSDNNFFPDVPTRLLFFSVRR